MLSQESTSKDRIRNYIRNLISRGLGRIIIIITAVSQLPTSAEEYTAKGIVSAEVFFYDKDGNRLDRSPEPNLPLTFTSDFVYYRRGDLWRLNITHPDPSFERNTVWRSIMPFSATNIIDIISYPDKTNVVGNAAVTILNSRFLVPDSLGAHFAWTVLNFSEIKKLLGPNLECFAFWKPGMPIDPRVKTHRIIESDSKWTYWNNGKFPQQDGEGNIVFVNEKPLMRTYPVPFDKGFSEAEFLVDWTSFGTSKAPKRVQVIFSGPGKKPSEAAISMIPLSKLDLIIESYSTETIDDDVFSPKWTNSVASVVDHRVTNQQGAPLAFLTKTNAMSPAVSTLEKHRHISETMKSLRKPTRTTVGIFGNITIVLLLVSPVIYWIKERLVRSPQSK